jgi:hypothetical protein
VAKLPDEPQAPLRDRAARSVFSRANCSEGSCLASSCWALNYYQVELKTPRRALTPLLVVKPREGCSPQQSVRSSLPEAYKVSRPASPSGE